jgi:hypothetical protein
VAKRRRGNAARADAATDDPCRHLENPGLDFMVACLGALGYERVAAVLAQIHRPRDIVPAYNPAMLSDQDAAHIYAYLVSIAAGKPASEIPILRGSANKK